MEKKKQNQLPKDFFNQPRPTVNLKEALKDVIPVEWVKKTKENQKKK